MAKIVIKYIDEVEKIKILNILSAGAKISRVSKPYKQGKYYRVYIYIK
ncbi:hypothetical protein [uncultured Clostridium sp.]|nr:hypothetical protein [uncultured Clostridium sp.]